MMSSLKKPSSLPRKRADMSNNRKEKIKTLLTSKLLKRFDQKDRRYDLSKAIEIHLDQAMNESTSLKQDDLNNIEQQIRLSMSKNQNTRASSLIPTSNKLEFPSIRRSNILNMEDIQNQRKVSLKAELLQDPKTNKRSHPKNRYKSINCSPRKLSPLRKNSTVEPSMHGRHHSLLREEETLSGITAQNEWDEIWKFAKIKEQEDIALKKHAKLAQKVKFNREIREQIMDNKKRKQQEAETERQKEIEMMNEIQQKLKQEDNAKYLNKIKANDSRSYNDKMQMQKDNTKRVMEEQKKKYEQSLLKKAKQEIEDERNNKLTHKLAKHQAGIDLFQQTEANKMHKAYMTQQQKLQDQKYSEEYSKLLDKQENVKKNLYADIKQRSLNQISELPTSRQKNIYGLSEKQEELQILNKMKDEEEQEKSKHYLSKMEKLQRQKELRNYLDQQLMEKQDKKDIEKFKNSYYHEQVEREKKQFFETQQNMKTKKRLLERTNLNSIADQIHEHQVRSPDTVINKFGT